VARQTADRHDGFDIVDGLFAASEAEEELGEEEIACARDYDWSYWRGDLIEVYRGA
jgi:hypothetical protein